MRLPRLRTLALPCRFPTAYPTRGVPVVFKNNNRTSSPCVRRPVRKIRSNSHPFFKVRLLSDTYGPYAFYCVKRHVLLARMNGRENQFFSCAAFDAAEMYLFSRNIRLLNNAKARIPDAKTRPWNLDPAIDFLSANRRRRTNNSARQTRQTHPRRQYNTGHP